jgi:transketolase
MADAPQLIGSAGDSLREAFGRAITELAHSFDRVVLLDADIAGGTGAHHFRKAHPNRFFQFGIAEQNMVAAASGMAATGLIPVVTTFAVFSLRALEQARLSAAYTERNVKIVASHPGLDVGPDGASAQCLEDLAAFRAIPNMVVISPADPRETELATRAILEYEGPVYMRTGRSNALRVFDDTYADFEIGKGKVVREGTDLTIVACGVQVGRALEASTLLKQDGIDARVVNMATIKPIDHDLLQSCAKETGAFVVTEDHNVLGGLGGAVAESLVLNTPCPMEQVGVQDTFGASGEPDELADHFGLSSWHIVNAAKRVITRK